MSSGENLLEVPASNLQPGMYVAALDRPWLETPFAMQGFFIRDEADAALVAKHCSFVMVDPRKYKRGAGSASAKSGNRRRPRNHTSLKREFETAKVDLESASEGMRKVFVQLRKGHRFTVKSIQKVIDPLIGSVLRNSEAMAALVRMKAKDDYLFNHSIANAVWAAVLGKQLGFELAQLKRLALGAAVVDVGMTQLDDGLTAGAGALSKMEREIVRSHVGLGVELLKAEGSVHAEVIETVAHHHERLNGSGYPQGLAGMDIPLNARIVGIVDSYDAMITDRPHAMARSSFEAVQELVDRKGELFQDALVEQFMQAIGLFPTGSIVELNTGEVGVVVAQNQQRRLRPKVVVILDQCKHRHKKLVVVDLAKYSQDSDDTVDLWIQRELEPAAHGINPDEYFL